MLLDGRFDGLLTVHRATLRRYRRDTQIRDRGRRYSRDIASGPSRADCSSAVHSDHVSGLLGSQGRWRGRNTYLYDPMWYIWGVPPPFTAAQVITSSRSLGVSQQRCFCAVPCAPLTHLLHASSPLRPDTTMTTTHVVVAAMPTPSPTAGKVAPPFPHYTAVLPEIPHCNSSKSVPIRPLRGRRGRFGTLLQQLECGIFGRTAVCSLFLRAQRVAICAGRLRATGQPPPPYFLGFPCLFPCARQPHL